MELQEHKALLEQNTKQISERIAVLQEQLAELQMMQQRQIGAVQMIDALIAEREQENEG